MAIKKGDKVSIDYEGRFESGEVFDSSQHGDHSHPLIFVVGSGQVIQGFEDAVIGMNEGEEKETTIAPKDAYGEYDARLKQEVPKSEFNLPRNQQPSVGMTLMMQSPEGYRVPVYITAVNKETVTIDLNHPLAGKTLIFKLKVVGINETIKETPEH